MLKASVIAGILAVLCATDAAAQTYRRDYIRRDGAYVPPSWSSSPDRSYNNNWSVRPNVNPYTGESGRRLPSWDDRPPARDPYGLSPSPRRRYW